MKVRFVVSCSGSKNLKRPVVIAVIAVLVMKATVDEIIGVVIMRNCFVTAARAVNVSLVVADMIDERVAAGRIGCAHLDHMLIDMIAMRMVEMSVVQVIDMVTVLDSQVAAVGAMLMVMVIVMGQIAVRHENVLSRAVQ